MRVRGMSSQYDNKDDERILIFTTAQNLKLLKKMWSLVQFQSKNYLVIVEFPSDK